MRQISSALIDLIEKKIKITERELDILRKMQNLCVTFNQENCSPGPVKPRIVSPSQITGKLVSEATPSVHEVVRELGRRGGNARAQKMTPEQRSNAARQAACARWAEKKENQGPSDGTVLNDMNENDWLCTLVFCYEDDKEEVAAEAETIGYLEGFAMMTETRLLALRGGHNPEDGVLLLFCFDTPAHKAEFRRLVDSNEFTARGEELWTVPDAAEIARAQPLAAVLPPEVAEHAKLVALTVIGCAKPGGEA